MNSAICTLFEGHYHFGVAVLINSLSNQGFKGSIYVGYKGKLPSWSDPATDDANINWKGAKTLTLNTELKVHFLPVLIDYQLTNYKPEFMLEIFNRLRPDVNRIAYFDPDIIIKCRWDFFETWMSHGVAMVHEISANDMPPSHPIRKEWAKVGALCNREVVREIHSYINAGFVGVSREYIHFLELFCEIIDVARAHYNFEDSVFQLTSDRTDIFYAHDQDAMNITAMCCDCPISEMGPEAMDFTNGGFTMSHATGSPKPWAKGFITSALTGITPSMADKIYWANVNGPINIFTSSKIKMTLAKIKLAGLIGRFYKKN